MRSYHLMRHPDKKGEEFVKVNLNAWAGMRRKGYVFVTDREESEARIAAGKEERATEGVEDNDDELELTMDNTKDEILAFADAHDIEVDPDNTKSELLEVIEEALAG